MQHKEHIQLCDFESCHLSVFCKSLLQRFIRATAKLM